MSQLSDTEFLNIVNLVMKKETASNIEFRPVTSMDDSIDANNLDSLGIMIFFVWLSEMFQIPDEEIVKFTDKKEFKLSALKEFILTHSTVSYAEALEIGQQL